jgi:hypothetical protein
MKHRNMEHHKILGLMDADTGECLVVGLNPTKMKTLGYDIGLGGEAPEAAAPGGGGGPREPREPREGRRIAGLVRHVRMHPGARSEREADIEAPGGQGQEREFTNLRFRMEGWDSVLPAPLWGLFSLTRQADIRRADRTPYEFTPEGFCAWVCDFCVWAAEQVLPGALAAHGVGTEAGALAVIRAVEGMSETELKAIAARAYEDAALHGAPITQGMHVRVGS